MSNKGANLYVVATPIGNMEDISARGARVLATVDVIAAEDTRRTAKLLHYLGIHKPTISVHEHNEKARIPELLRRLKAGQSVALVSDAGTPLISDPGFHLVQAAHSAGIKVVPIPGPSAFAAALSVSGLPTDAFIFEGFLPTKAPSRRRFLETRKSEFRTLIFYESPHRIIESLRDMVEIFGSQRPVAFIRELTKKFETVRLTSLGELFQWVSENQEQQKGEIVVIVQGAEALQGGESDINVEHVLSVLLGELPLKQAVSLASRLTGRRKNDLYDMALRIQQNTR